MLPPFLTAFDCPGGAKIDEGIPKIIPELSRGLGGGIELNGPLLCSPFLRFSLRSCTLDWSGFCLC